MPFRLLAVLAHPDDESFGPGGTFARYADEGVDVHIAIATDGAAGSVATGYEEARERLADVRAVELVQAVEILGATLHNLGYRDSGYINDPANEHPAAFVQADLTEATGRVVRLIREIRPDVVITHDETGGYFHPDHIQCWRITTPAFHAAGDPEKFPEIAAPPFQPQRLYYTALPNTWLKIVVLMTRLMGRDPTKFGRNEDIDITKVGVDPGSIHARVPYKKYFNVKRKASAAHASQGGGGGFRLPIWLQRQFLSHDNFIRAYPPLPDVDKEHDLFAGIIPADNQ